MDGSLLNTSNNILHQDILYEAYRQNEKLIHQICWKFHKKYGGDIDDWLSEAHLTFMESINQHQPELSQFITWLQNKIVWRFKSKIRTQAKQSKIKFSSTEQNELCLCDLILHEHKPCFMYVVENASEPVQVLWSIINYPPPELTGELNINDPDNSWDAIRHYLFNHLKWPVTIVQQSMEELRNICT